MTAAFPTRCRAGAASARRRGRALGKDERGAAVIEFAFIAAPLIALLIAILETSLTFFAQQTLETTAESAARQIVTGQAQRAGLTQAQFQNMVCGKLPSFMQCTKVMVDVQTATSFAAANTGLPTITFDSAGNPTNTWQFQMGNAGDIVTVRIMYLWPVVPGPLGFSLANAGANTRVLLATQVFKSEPYGS